MSDKPQEKKGLPVRCCECGERYIVHEGRYGRDIDAHLKVCKARK